MRCPYCEKEIELTWERYLKSPMGRHVCPQCNKRFRMKHTIKYFGTLVVLWIIFGIIPAVIARFLGATEVQAIIIYFLCGSIGIVPIDRKIDATWRGTAPLE